MRIGLCAYDVLASDFCAMAVAADEAGFASLWLGEHVILPVGYGSEHPTTGGTTVQHHTGPIVDPKTRLVDPLVTFAGVSTVTSRATLATGIYLAALRHPVVVARMTATLQDLAGGRFVLGLGSGWLREEFDALGVPFAERGARLDETIDALRALWSAEVVEHDGPAYQFGPVTIGPEPVHVPLVLGGNSDPALRRAAARADGWFGSGTPSLDDARELRDRAAAACEHVGRTEPLPLWFRVAGADPGLLQEYADDGFDQVVLWADQLWQADGDVETKRGVFFERVQRLGLPFGGSTDEKG